jgi:hypothetical protein
MPVNPRLYARKRRLDKPLYLRLLWPMFSGLYRLLQENAERIAKTLPQPAFYDRYAEPVRSSAETLRNDRLISLCREHLDESQLECAHGLCHCEAVARDAGAIVLIEGQERGMQPSAIKPLCSAAIVAGLLHDIKRREQDHALRGSIEADRILSLVGVEKRYRDYISYAIRNHEAFRAICDLGDEAGCLVSDALYDADKFRWGPENFTTTLWTIVRANATPPERLYEVFPERMKGIVSIKDTFRTATGRRYGPEIIDQGIMIGNAIYAEMGLMLEK